MALPTGHLAVGAAAWLNFPPRRRNWLGLGGLTTLAILPDFDIFLSLFDRTLPFTHHRNFMHSWWFSLVICALVALTTWKIKKTLSQALFLSSLTAFLLGSHLLMDTAPVGQWRNYDIFPWEGITWQQMVTNLICPLGLRMALEDIVIFGLAAFLLVYLGKIISTHNHFCQNPESLQITP